MSFSRTSQRKSQVADELLALTSARSSIVVSLQSLTWRLTTLPFQSLDWATTSASFLRMTSTGAV